MADLIHTARVVAFNSAGLATMGHDSRWDARLTEYLRLWALDNAAAEYGPAGKHHENRLRAQYDLEHEHGKGWRTHPAGIEWLERTQPISERIEKELLAQFHEPLWNASRDLAMTPAPTLAAALFKAQLIDWEDLSGDGNMPRDCFEIVAEDMARLAAPSPDAPILEAFARYQAGHAELAASDPNEKRKPGEDMTPGEKLAWDHIDAADTEVHATVATTPTAVVCKLWIALVHSTSDRDEEQHAVRADLAWFEDQDDRLDWNMRQIVSALRDLKAMEVTSC